MDWIKFCFFSIYSDILVHNETKFFKMFQNLQMFNLVLVD